VLPNVARATQVLLFDAALQFIEEQAAATGEAACDLMVNHVIEGDEAGACELYELPADE
jgi:hypothetical protein